MSEEGLVQQPALEAFIFMGLPGALYINDDCWVLSKLRVILWTGLKTPEDIEFRAIYQNPNKVGSIFQDCRIDRKRCTRMFREWLGLVGDRAGFLSDCDPTRDDAPFLKKMASVINAKYSAK